MNDNKRMILGYMVGGSLVMVLVPSIIYTITSLLDSFYKIEIIQNTTIRWTVSLLLLGAGLIYGIWSIIIQNIVGKGGPLEIGNLLGRQES